MSHLTEYNRETKQHRAEHKARVAEIIARSLGARITVVHNALSHDQDYIMVGETHTVIGNIGRDAAGVLTPPTYLIHWTLRPFDAQQYWILSDGVSWTAESTLNTTTRLAL